MLSKHHEALGSIYSTSLNKTLKVTEHKRTAPRHYEGARAQRFRDTLTFFPEPSENMRCGKQTNIINPSTVMEAILCRTQSRTKDDTRRKATTHLLATAQNCTCTEMSRQGQLNYLLLLWQSHFERQEVVYEKNHDQIILSFI